MKKAVIQNGTVIKPFEMIKDVAVHMDDGIITGLSRSAEISADEQVIDARGLYVCPGLIDIHTHGGGGSDFMDATDADFAQAMRFHCSNGTTSLVATTVSAPDDQTSAMLEVVRRHKNKVLAGSRLLGANLEGPFLSRTNCGAHLPEYLRIPHDEQQWLYAAYADVALMTTLSPELSGSIELIRDLAGRGIVVAGGHDDADDDQIKRAIDAGMSHITHVFCATSMIAFRQGRRNVGLSMLALLDNRLTVELIADNNHLPPDLVKLALRCKGADKACLVSDCMRAGGMPVDEQTYVLGPRQAKNAQKAIVTGDVASLPDKSRFAGSITPVGKMVQNLVRRYGMSLTDAVRMATDTPARIIHQENRIGRISPGLYADFCFMDHDFNIVKTVTAGETVFSRT